MEYMLEFEDKVKEQECKNILVIMFDISCMSKREYFGYTGLNKPLKLISLAYSF